jgi:glycosyltransferase involved in cell wall biosynthesis
VHVVPFCATAPDDGPAPRTAGVFAGGDSLRDYRPLLEAAGSIHAPVRVATRLPVPPSAAQAGPLAPDDYARQARAARVVVVPLQAATGRSGGQQTYLNAMLQAKPVVVTDAPGVRDHVVDGVTGLIVPPADVAALANAVNRLLDDAELASRLGAAAREAVLARFTGRHRFDALLALASRIAD